MPQENPAFTEEEKDRFRADPSVMQGMHAEISRAFADNFSSAVIDANSAQLKLTEDVCRANLENSVNDPELRGSHDWAR